MDVLVRIPTAAKENSQRTMCVGPVVLASLVSSTATVRQVNVVIRTTNVQQETAAALMSAHLTMDVLVRIPTAAKENTRRTMCVGPVVLGSLVSSTATVRQVNVVIRTTNVQRETAAALMSALLTVIVTKLRTYLSAIAVSNDTLGRTQFVGSVALASLVAPAMIVLMTNVVILITNVPIPAAALMV
jgi:anti-anti-sigma regulatory factor